MKDKEAKELLRIEFYNDINPDDPKAFDRWRRRLQRFIREDEFQRWRSAVVDSTSGAVGAAMLEQQAINPGQNKAKYAQWVNGVTSALERPLVQTLPYLPDINIILIAHIQHERIPIKINEGGAAHDLEKGLAEYQDTYIRSLALPGRLRTSNAVPRQYQECYRVYIDADEKPHLQVEADGEWPACTQINQGRNGVLATYKTIWKDKEPEPAHFVFYGDFGSMKSTLAAQFPTPLLVWHFDGLGKEKPYLRRFPSAKRKEWEGEEGQRIISLLAPKKKED